MSDKLIWQSKDNYLRPIEVVYESIYGMPIEKCMEILWKYSYRQLIPVEWIKSKIDAILDSYPDGNEETEILCKLLYE